MEIEEIFIRLGLKSDGVKKGAKEAEKAVDNSVNNMRSSLMKLNSSMEIWGRMIAALGVAASAAFYQFIKDANALGDIAKRADIGVKKLSQLSMAVESAGGSAQDFQADILSLTRQLEETAETGTSKLAEGLGLYGISTEGKDAYKILWDLAGLAESMGEKDYIPFAESLGISASTIELTKNGTYALKNQMHAMKELGVITGNDAKLAKDFSSGMRQVWQALRGLANIVFRMVLPGFVKFLEIGRRVLTFLQKHEHFVQAFFIGLATAITAFALPALAKLAAAMMANPITLIVATVAALALVVEDLAVWAEGGEAAFSALWEAIFGSPEEAQATWEEIKQIASDTVDSMIETWGRLKESLSNFIGMMKDAFSGFFGWIGEKFDWLSAKISSVLGGAAAKGSQYTEGAGGSMDISGFQPEANGGIISSPTRALVGEAGAEAVIPISPGKRNRGLELLSKIAGNFLPNNDPAPKFEMPSISLPKFEMPKIQAAQALPMGGAGIVNNNNVETSFRTGNIYIQAKNGDDAARQFISGLEDRYSMMAAQANSAY